jgi:hypothetical protein
MFSQPPPLRTSFISTVSAWCWCQWKTGLPAPRLLPVLRPVMLSTEFWRR